MLLNEAFFHLESAYWRRRITRTGRVTSNAATISPAPGEGHGAQIAVFCLLLIIVIIASAGWRPNELRAILSSSLSKVQVRGVSACYIVSYV